MNQILYVEGKKRKGPADIKKVIRFFAVSLIILGIIFVGQSSYALYRKVSSTTVQKEVPTVSVERQDNNVIIDVTHTKIISRMLYNWNGEEDTVVYGNSGASLQETVELPVGSNTLNIKVIDIDGQETIYQKEYVVEDIVPVIELSIVGNDIKITVTSKYDLEYITYRWNNESEVKVEMSDDAENKTTLEKSTSIPIGQNTLVVNAYDMAGNKVTKTQEILGTTRPEISVAQDNQYLVITVSITDNQSLKLVDYTLNGQPYRIDFVQNTSVSFWNSVDGMTVEGTDGAITKMTYRQIMTDIGDNYIEITAYNLSDAITTFKGLCRYQP